MCRSLLEADFRLQAGRAAEPGAGDEDPGQGWIFWNGESVGGHTGFLEHGLERAEAGKPALEQVEPDEGGEPEKIAAHEKRTGPHAQGEGDEHERAGKDADEAFDGHDGTPDRGTVARGGGRVRMGLRSDCQR